MKIERSIVRRDANRPELAEGDRTLVELDPEQVTRMLRQARGLLGDLERIFVKPKRRPRRRTR
jgi:hypothetical protein